MNYGSHKLLEPKGPFQACNWIALIYFYKLSSYVTKDKVCLLYEEQSPNVIKVNNWCLWLDSYETHKGTILSTRRFSSATTGGTYCYHWDLIGKIWSHDDYVCVDSSVYRTCSKYVNDVYGVQCTVYSLQCTVYSVQCEVHSVQCTVHSVQCTVHSVQCTIPLHILYRSILNEKLDLCNDDFSLLHM
jgi:hypothetical protein